MVSAFSVRGSIRSKPSGSSTGFGPVKAQTASSVAASRPEPTAGRSRTDVTAFVSGSMRTIPSSLQAQTDPKAATMPWQARPSTGMVATTSLVVGSIRTMAGSG